MSDVRKDMAGAVEAATLQLARLRGCSVLEAAQAVAATYAENLRDSRQTSMETYWRTMVEIADERVGDAMRDAGS